MHTIFYNYSTILLHPYSRDTPLVRNSTSTHLAQIKIMSMNLLRGEFREATVPEFGHHHYLTRTPLQFIMPAVLRWTVLVSVHGTIVELGLVLLIGLVFMRRLQISALIPVSAATATITNFTINGHYIRCPTIVVHSFIRILRVTHLSRCFATFQCSGCAGYKVTGAWLHLTQQLLRPESPPRGLFTLQKKRE